MCRLSCSRIMQYVRYKGKIVEVQGSYNVSPGDNVTILMKKSIGYKALFLGYILPFILLVLTL